MHARSPSASLDLRGTTDDISGTAGSNRLHAVRVIAAFSLSKVIPGLVTFASIPIWLAGYGADNYALYSMHWVTAMIGTALTTQWVRQAILRYTGFPGMEYERVRWQTRWLLESCNLVAILPVVLLATFMVEEVTERTVFLVVAGVSLLCQSRLALAASLLQRDGRSGRYAFAEIVRSAGTLALSLLLLAAAGRTPWGIVAAGALATIAALLVARPRRAVYSQVQDEVNSRRIIWAYWRFGWPMSLWIPVSTSLIYLDRFVVMVLFGPDRAGNYAAAADMAVRGIGLVVTPVILFLHPSFMRAWNTVERQEALRRWKRMTLGTAASVVVAALSGLVGYVVLGDILLGSPVTAATFGLLAFGGAAWQLATMAHKPLEASGRTVLMLGTLVGSLGVTVALNLLIAGPLGELGVAISSVAGALTYIVAVLWLHARQPLTPSDSSHAGIGFADELKAQDVPGRQESNGDRR